MSKIFSLFFFSIIFYSCSFKTPNSGQEKVKEDTSYVYNEMRLIEIDITKKYPSKEIILQEIADVEYIPLETNDEFLYEGPLDYTGNELIIGHNFEEGNIFIFDRSGKAIRRINHKGQGRGEYSIISSLAYDQINKELFISDMYRKKIYVYDLDGAFKRSLNYIKGSEYSFLADFDSSSLLCYSEIESPFVIISKSDGKKRRDVFIPFDKRIYLGFSEETGKKIQGETITRGVKQMAYPICRNGNVFLLNEVSSDSIYRLTTEGELCPIIVQKPSIQNIKPILSLAAGFETNQYYFMYTIENVWSQNPNYNYNEHDLIFDRTTGEIFEYEIINEDYPTMRGKSYSNGASNSYIKNQVAYLVRAYKLKEAYDKGELTGKLKDAVSTLKEDDNPVLIITKFK